MGHFDLTTPSPSSLTFPLLKQSNSGTATNDTILNS